MIPLIAAMDIGLEDAGLPAAVTEHELDDVLAALSPRLSPVSEQSLSVKRRPCRSDQFWRSAETEDEVKRFMERATAKVNDWSTTHASTISREEAAAGFDVNLNLPGAASVVSVMPSGRLPG